MRFSIVVKITKWVIQKTKKHATPLYTVFTGVIMVVMFFTMLQQHQFNKRQLALYELSTAPLVFVKLDSLSFSQGYVFFKVKNVGNSPALNVRVACRVTTDKENPLAKELRGEVQGDIFPSDSAKVSSKQDFGSKGTWYLHFRVDVKDFLRKKYFYKATYFLIFSGEETTGGFSIPKSGKEFSEYGELDR